MLFGNAKVTAKNPDLYLNDVLKESNIGSLKLVAGTKITITYDVNGRLVFDVDAATTYLGLTDTVDESYATKAWSVPRVNDAETDLQLQGTEELILVDAKFTELQDCPSSLTGYGGYLLRVRIDEQGIEFVAP